MPLWLSEADVGAVLAPGELITVIQDALAAFSTGRVTQPVRTALEISDRSFFAVMPAFHAERAILGAKLVSVVPANAATINAVSNFFMMGSSSRWVCYRLDQGHAAPRCPCCR